MFPERFNNKTNASRRGVGCCWQNPSLAHTITQASATLITDLAEWRDSGPCRRQGFRDAFRRAAPGRQGDVCGVDPVDSDRPWTRTASHSHVKRYTNTKRSSSSAAHRSSSIIGLRRILVSRWTAAHVLFAGKRRRPTSWPS